MRTKSIIMTRKRAEKSLNRMQYSKDMQLKKAKSVQANQMHCKGQKVPEEKQISAVFQDQKEDQVVHPEADPPVHPKEDPPVHPKEDQVVHPKEDPVGHLKEDPVAGPVAGPAVRQKEDPLGHPKANLIDDT